MTRTTRQSLLIGAGLMYALAAFTFLFGRAGDFGAAVVGIVVGTVIGLIVAVSEWLARRAVRGD